MEKQVRSVFDWLTVGAAWGGVVIASWVAYQQYLQSTVRPNLEFGQFGACYRVESEEDELIYWRMVVSNSGEEAAKDVFIKIVDVPDDAKLWASVAHDIHERTEDTLLVKLTLVPPKCNVFLAIQPFSRRGQKLMPYSREEYYEGGLIRKSALWQSMTEYEVYEKLAKTEDYISGVKGSHRQWTEPVTKEDIDIGKHQFTIEDR